MLRRLIRSIVLNTPLEKPARAALKLIRGSHTASAEFIPQTFKSFELPSGISEETLCDVFLSFSLDDGPIGQLDPYVHDAFTALFIPGNWSVMRPENAWNLAPTPTLLPGCCRSTLH